MQLTRIDVSFKESHLHNTIFRKNVRLVKRAGAYVGVHWLATIEGWRCRSIGGRPVPRGFRFVSGGGGLLLFFFLCAFFRSSTPLFTALLSVQCIKTRFFKTATVSRSFVEDFHLNVIPTSLLHRRDLHKFLSWKDARKKNVCPTDYDFHVANIVESSNNFYIAFLYSD